MLFLWQPHGQPTNQSRQCKVCTSKQRNMLICALCAPTYVETNFQFNAQQQPRGDYVRNYASMHFVQHKT